MPDIDKEKTCCFIGHRNVENNTVLDDVLSAVITDMIENKKQELLGTYAQAGQYLGQQINQLLK